MTVHAHADPASFEASVLPLTPWLRAAALRLAGSPADADDLVQETVLRAWRSWPQYQRDSNCRAWLRRIMTNAFINRYRRRRREREVLAEVRIVRELQRAPEHEPGILRRSLGDDLHRGLGQLRQEHREVLWLVDVEGCSYHDAARRLQCPIGTVMSRLHRARRGLARQLSAASGPPSEAAEVTARVA